MSATQPQRPRTLPAEQRRTALLDAAQELIVEHGVPATSIDRVAARAGVSKGAVYHHFASKDDLLVGLEHRFTTRLRDRARSALEAAAETPAGRAVGTQVAAWAAAVSHAYLDDLALHDALFYGWAAPSREASSDNVLITDLRDLLIDDGACVSAAAADLLAGYVVGGITTAIDRAVLADRTHPRQPLIELVVDLTVTSCTSTDPRSSTD